MTPTIYTEERLAELRSVEKRASGGTPHWLEKPVGTPVHRQRSYKISATKEGTEYRFEIYERQSLRDEEDFSCGIAHVSLDGSRRLTLARYNGPAHEHEDIVFKPHIHVASERSIISGRKPEREAEATDRFSTLGGALACLLEDFNVQGISAVHDDERLF